MGSVRTPTCSAQPFTYCTVNSRKENIWTLVPWTHLWFVLTPCRNMLQNPGSSWSIRVCLTTVLRMSCVPAPPISNPILMSFALSCFLLTVQQISSKKPKIDVALEHKTIQQICLNTMALNSEILLLNHSRKRILLGASKPRFMSSFLGIQYPVTLNHLNSLSCCSSVQWGKSSQSTSLDWWETQR